MTEPNPLHVQIKARNVILRAGPGTEFPALGMAQNGTDFEVAEWTGQWLRVQIDAADESSPKTAWVRNDLVRVLTAE